MALTVLYVPYSLYSGPGVVEAGRSWMWGEVIRSTAGWKPVSIAMWCFPRRLDSSVQRFHPGGNPGANLKSISHRCYLFEVAFVWELTQETIVLPMGCLQGGRRLDSSVQRLFVSRGLFPHGRAPLFHSERECVCVYEREYVCVHSSRSSSLSPKTPRYIYIYIYILPHGRVPPFHSESSLPNAINIWALRKDLGLM